MKILLRHGNREEWKMVESAKYQNETELQKLLADSPSLITIDDVRPGAGSLVTAIREFPLDIGYVDLIAFSAQGDMAIIECKLADNPEIKRKVIGQTMEYGAHIWGMTYNELDEKIKLRTGSSLAAMVEGQVNDPAWDEEEFRTNIESTLESGSFILMIVVDAITDDLSRIIRFVNACGKPAFSFAALEMRRFLSGDAEMLVPRIVGDTRTTDKVSRASGRKRWTIESFLEDVTQKLGPGGRTIVDDLYNFSKQHAHDIRLGTGTASGSFTFILERNGVTGSVFSVYSNGILAVNLGYLAEKICPQEDLGEFKNQLATIPPFADIRNTDKYYFNLEIRSAFSNPEYLEQFKEKVILLKSKLASKI